MVSTFNDSRWIGKMVLFVAIQLLAFTCSMGQVTTGNLQGVVTDPNGALVAGATVKITNAGNGQSREVTTNGEGFYRVTNLLPGDNYTLDASASGFSPVQVTKVAVRLASENRADIKFGAVASASAAVTVTSENTALIQSTQNQLSTSYSTSQLTQLPFNGGLIDNLALLTPGVAVTGDTTFTNGIGIAANGNRGRSNNFQIDGQDNNDNSVSGPSLFLTNTDAIGEFQIITNNFSAEFGRNSGAQVNTITKSGTNNFHGSVFEYLQNSALNTRNNGDKSTAAAYKFLGDNLGGSTGAFFKDYATHRQGKNPFTANRFGGSVGGPIKKNKYFFFVTYQADRQRGEQDVSNFTSDSLILTPESVAAVKASGNFPIGSSIVTNSGVGGYPSSVKFPGTGTIIIVPPLLDTNGDGVPDAFGYQGITPNRLSDVAYIRSGGPGSPIIPLYAGEAVRIMPNNFTENQLITHEDLNLTSKDVLSIRYIRDHTFFPDSPATGRALAGAFFDVPSRNNNLGVTYTRTLTPRLVNEARFNFSRLFVAFGDTSSLPAPQVGWSGTRTLEFDLLQTFGTQLTLPQSRQVDVYQEQDTITTTLGNHALKFGADIRQQKVKNFFLPNRLGVYTFNGSNPFAGFSAANATAAAAGTPPADTFFFSTNPADDRAGFRATSLENMLLGRFRTVSFALGTPNINTSQDDYFGFLQDDWRIRPNLTLNLGVRYELSTQPFNPIIEALNAREANSGTAIFDTKFDLSTRTAQKLPLDKNNFSPRIGFAWSPNLEFLGDRFSQGKTVIRGGIGIAYDPSFFNIVLNTVTAAPYAAAGIVRQNPGAAGSQVFPFLPKTTAELNTTPGTNGGDPRLFNQTRVSPDFHNPYTVSYHFGIQQELFKNTVLEARYVGSHIVGQFQTVNGNPQVSFLNRAAQCLGLASGVFSNGLVVGSPAATAAAACSGSGFSNNAGTNGDGRVDPNFGATRLRTNGATASYNSLQMRFDTRLGRSITLNANYTFARTIDNSSEIFSSGGAGQGIADPQRFFDSTKGERGLSAFHQKHVFTDNFIWDLPSPKNQKGFLGHLLSGYQLSGLMRMQSGETYTPIEFFGTYDPNFEVGFIGAGALRPFNGNPNAPKSTIAFGATAAGALFGTAGMSPGQFIVFDTRNPASQGTIVSNATAALQQARVIYNDFGLFNQGFAASLSSLEAFQFFKTPFGDLGRSPFTGPAFYGVNAAISKTTRITERTKLEFRIEAKNVLNRRNIVAADTITEDAAIFSTATKTNNVVSTYGNTGFVRGDQRELRLGVRFIF